MNAHPTQQPAVESTRPRISTAAMLGKSAVCVALFAGIAWIGLASGGRSAPGSPAVAEASAAGKVAVTGDRAAAHRRQVFEERRARFEGITSTEVAANGLAHPYP